MRCANCGNEDLRWLHDEGDVFFCSKCKHRTQKETGMDDVSICPYCGRLKDRKHMVCPWCNRTMGSRPGMTVKEYAATERLSQEFEEELTPENTRFWNLRNKR